MPKRLSFKMGLRGQLVLLFLLVSFIPLLIVAFLAREFGVKALEKTIGENLARLAQEKLDQADYSIFTPLNAIRGELNGVRDAVVLASSRPDDTEIQRRLTNKLKRLEDLAGPRSEIIITNSQGQVIQASNPGLHRRQIDAEWWKRAYNEGLGHEYVDDLQYDADMKVHVLPVAFPILTSAGTKVVGILRAMITLPNFSDAVRATQEQDVTGQGLEFALMTKHGRVITSSAENEYTFREHIEMTDAAMEAINSAKTDDQFAEFFGYERESGIDIQGDKRVYGWARTQRWRGEPWKADQNFTDWTVLVSQPESVAFYEINLLTEKILTFTLISCVIVIPIVWLVSRRIVKPIVRIALASRAIGKGDFNHHVPVTSNNEVGALAQEFNSMRDDLKHAIELITKEEKKMTAIVNSLAEGLVLVDGNHRVLHINPAAEHLLNVGADQVGEELTLIVQDLTLARALKESQGQISLNETVNLEVTLDQLGETSTLRIVASPFLDEAGAVLGTVYVFDDITREKEIDRMKSDFVSLVSHELRTPMTSIIGFVSLILDGKTGPINDKQRRSLVRVHHQAERLAALINDLLDISRIEAGRVEMKREEISVSEVAKQRIEEISPQADAKSIELRLFAPESLPHTIGDQERIGQVFTNLIGNAIKFTPESGKIAVRISADGTLSGKADRALHIEVIDTGEGIPIKEREQVFNRFHQLGNINTRQEGGTGLGLSIVKSIVESHGGTVWVEDGYEGRGSSFQFTLPIELTKDVGV